MHGLASSSSICRCACGSGTGRGGLRRAGSWRRRSPGILAGYQAPRTVPASGTRSRPIGGAAEQRSPGPTATMPSSARAERQARWPSVAQRSLPRQHRLQRDEQRQLHDSGGSISTNLGNGSLPITVNQTHHRLPTHGDGGLTVSGTGDPDLGRQQPQLRWSHGHYPRHAQVAGGYSLRQRRGRELRLCSPAVASGNLLWAPATSSSRLGHSRGGAIANGNNTNPGYGAPAIGPPTPRREHSTR